MIELKRIVNAFESTDFANTSSALATVIKVEGSSYRSPGAKMYILKNGLWEGSVSGGCLEGDVLKQAREVMESGQPKIMTYDTNEDNNHQLGINLGCNGIIHIYIEPITRDSGIIPVFRDLIQSEKRTTMIKQLDSSLAFALMNEDEDIIQSTFADQKIPQPGGAFSHQPSGLFQHQESMFFYEEFEPAIEVLIVGGGGDAQPVVSFANQLGWNVRLTDECAAHLFPKNFPNARVIQCDRQYISQKITTGRHTAVILMTHNLDYDRDALIDLLPGEAPYIGIVGPRKRWIKMRSQLEDRGIKLSNEDLHRIHAPVGLDIGADTREEIALSIIAEIKAFFAKRNAAPLRKRASSIHQKDPVTGEVFKTIQIRS